MSDKEKKEFFPEGSTKPEDFFKYTKEMAKSVVEHMKDAEIHHRDPKGGPPSPNRKHLDPEVEDDLKEAETKLAKLACSLEGLSRGLVETLDRISEDDLKAKEEGDHTFINEGSAPENWDEVAKKEKKIEPGPVIEPVEDDSNPIEEVFRKVVNDKMEDPKKSKKKDK